MAPTVAVLGGGVAGLSAAHELAERGFDVTVYEPRDAAGRQGAQHPVCRARVPAGDATCRPSTASASSRLLSPPAGHDARGSRTRARRRRRRQPRRRRRGSSSRGPAARNELRRARARARSAGRPRRCMPLRARGRRRSSASRRTSTRVLRGAPADAADELRRTPLRRSGSTQSWWEFSGADQRSPAYQQLPRRRADAHARRRARARR